MICMLSALAFAFVGGLAWGLIVFAGFTIPLTFSIVLSLPIAKFATIETFIEIGLIIKLILTKIFESNFLNETLGEILGIIIVVLFGAASIYISFNSNGYLFDVFPYSNIYNFFSVIIEHVADFFKL